MSGTFCLKMRCGWTEAHAFASQCPLHVHSHWRVYLSVVLTFSVDPIPLPSLSLYLAPLQYVSLLFGYPLLIWCPPPNPTLSGALPVCVFVGPVYSADPYPSNTPPDLVHSQYVFLFLLCPLLTTFTWCTLNASLCFLSVLSLSGALLIQSTFIWCRHSPRMSVYCSEVLC